MKENNKIRIAKFIASTGYCSRREAEKLLLTEKIQVNGKHIQHPATFVTSTDEVIINGRRLTSPDKPRLWLYHKPRGLITSYRDPACRPTVFDNLPCHLPRVISVGRLDYNSEGLLLLTNNGHLSRALELPSAGLIRKYRCRAFGRLDNQQIKQLAEGIKVKGIRYKDIIVDEQKLTSSNNWLTISLSEGKNREIRNALRYFGIEVSRLIRIAYGPFSLGNLPALCVQELPYQAFHSYCPK